MRIAVVAVAAENGGALSVLNDFIDALHQSQKDSDNEWYIFTSVVDVKESRNIHCIKNPDIKKSWFHRLRWEYTIFKSLIKKYRIDKILSLQNNALPIKNIHQTVYFHNILLVNRQVKFSFLARSERKLAIYSYLLAPYIRNSWKNADEIVVQGDSVKKAVSYYFPEEKITSIRPNMSTLTTEERAGRIKGYIYPTSALKYKNLELLIEAASLLHTQGYDFDILITLTGKENEYAQRMLLLSETIPNIRFIGRLSRKELINKYVEYGLVMPSLLESFSVPILEAMSMGSVVLGIEKPYVYDAVQETGYKRMYMFKEDPQSLAECMIKGLSDSETGSFTNKNKNTYLDLVSKLAGGEACVSI